MRKRLAIFMILFMLLITACDTKQETKKEEVIVEENNTEEITKTEDEEDEEIEISESYGNNAVMSDFEKASLEEVNSIINGEDLKTLLIDARGQESYSGWALDGAKYGGHLRNSLLFSSRWLDCEYSGSAPRKIYLDRAMEDQGINKDKNIIVYDYKGKEAAHVAKYFMDMGIDNVKVFQANELIDLGQNLENYENYNRFLPVQIVKNVSDYKTGKTTEILAETSKVLGDNFDNIILVDVGWGNAKESTYEKVGHVPGAIHINTDSYERPRVYIPEKRSDYAKEWRLIPLEEFRDTVCPQYGINKDSIVIITGMMNAPQGRLAYMLRSLGVKVYVMTGTLNVWKYEGYELAKGPETLVIPDSVEEFGREDIPFPDEILWMDSVKEILSGKKAGQIADNRTRDEWDGKYSGYPYHDLAGRIENSIWCPLSTEEKGEFFDNVDTTPRTKGELIKHMEKYNLDVNNTVAFFCGDSWEAAHIAYFCQAHDINTIKQWGEGWIPWSNNGNEFIDHAGRKVKYDKYRDTLLDNDGNDVRDDINIVGETE